MFTMVIRNVKGNREEYRTQKAATTLRKPLTDPGLIAYAAQPDPQEPAILSVEQWPALDTKTRKSIDVRSQCFINEINSESPLLDGETVLSDLVTVLTSDYLGRPEGTAVLKRVTDKADLYYLSSFASAALTGHVTLEKPLPPFADYRPGPRLAFVEMLVVPLLVEFAKGLAGAVGKGIGAQLVAAIFPDSTKWDYKTLLKDFSAIVKEANTEQTIDEQGGIISSVLEQLVVDYLPRKHQLQGSQNGKKELFSMVCELHKSLSETLNILKREPFAKKGIPLFTSGSALSFAIYQEMALEDPDVEDPKNSSYVASLETAVDQAAAHVNATVQRIITETVTTRTSQISEIYNDPWVDINVSKNLWYYSDSAIKKTFGPYERHNKKDDPQSRCKAAREAYFKKIESATKDEITRNVTWMLDSATAWQTLLNRGAWIEFANAVPCKV